MFAAVDVGTSVSGFSLNLLSKAFSSSALSLASFFSWCLVLCYYGSIGSSALSGSESSFAEPSLSFSSFFFLCGFGGTTIFGCDLAPAS